MDYADVTLLVENISIIKILTEIVLDASKVIALEVNTEKLGICILSLACKPKSQHKDR
jgi:hypothetical protein